MSMIQSKLFSMPRNRKKKTQISLEKPINRHEYQDDTDVGIVIRGFKVSHSKDDPMSNYKHS